jgi:hypothetical protein
VKHVEKRIASFQLCEKLQKKKRHLYLIVIQLHISRREKLYQLNKRLDLTKTRECNCKRRIAHKLNAPYPTATTFEVKSMTVSNSHTKIVENRKL